MIFLSEAHNAHLHVLPTFYFVGKLVSFFSSRSHFKIEVKMGPVSQQHISNSASLRLNF